MDRPRARVLLVLENNPYPYDPRGRRIAETLVEGGYAVGVICPGEPGQPRHEVAGGVHVYRFPVVRARGSLLGYVWEYGYGTLMLLLYTLVLAARPGFDILHASNPPETVFFVGLLARLLGKQLVFDYRDLGPELYATKFGGPHGPIYRLLLALEAGSARLADLVVAVNESYRRIVIERYGVPARKTVVVRNGPRLREFVPVDPDPGVRAKAPIILGYVGNMGSQDGVDYLLRALHVVRYDLGRPDFYCVLVGPVDDGAGMAQLAAGLGVADRVQFTGRLPFGPDLLRYLAAADICVEPAPSNPLHDKSTLMKIMEYMALGKPTVAFDLPESRVSAGPAALYAPANDEAAFARQIVALMDDPDLRRRMGAAGRARVEARLSWEHEARRLCHAYGVLVRRRAARAAAR